MKPSDIFGIVGLLITGIPELLFGLWFLRDAESLVRFAFPKER